MSSTQERIAALVADLHKPFLVEYAYATSDHARIYGMSRTGCYYVSKYNGLKPRIAVSSHGYETREEAQAFANIMASKPEPLQWVIRGLNQDGSEERFYTGRAGKFWLAPERTAAFCYESKEAAQRKAKLFNTREPLHGFYFHATTSK